MKTNDREIDWKFWAAVPIVFVVLYLGLRVFHRFFELGRSLSVDGLAMIGITLVAAAIGFLAILLQIRSSSNQLRDQMREQRDAERGEQERQKKAVATAIAFEIDFIYRGFVRDVEEIFRIAPSDTNFAQDLIAKNVDKLPFTVYEGCAHLLGSLPVALVEAIVHFYGGITVYLMSLNELYLALQRAQNASLGDRRRIDVEVLVQQVRETAPHVKKLAAKVSERLCEFAEVPKDRMAVLVATQ